MISLLSDAPVLADARVFIVAALGVFLVGLGKGGMGGTLGVLGVPTLSFVMPPLQAAALLLPILLSMDAVGLWAWRRYFDRSILRTMIPGALVGIAAAAATASYVSDAAVKLMVGLVAMAYVARYAASLIRSQPAAPRRQRPLAAASWGSVAGFTSFVAHAGGPPYQIYTLPLGLDPKLFTGTSVMFFAIVNVIKVAPYIALGELDLDALKSALILSPVAVVSTFAGAAIVKRMHARIFYPLMNAAVLLAGVKMLWDGVSGLLG
ncbi:MAG: sulfite exporter TauE/SafE family protein [Neomegalonema sp.]|nr:sulfite exporter TauE/SafE family protein [Neomegalonema sp.]